MIQAIIVALLVGYAIGVATVLIHQDIKGRDVGSTPQPHHRAWPYPDAEKGRYGCAHCGKRAHTPSEIWNHDCPSGNPS